MAFTHIVYPLKLVLLSLMSKNSPPELWGWRIWKSSLTWEIHMNHIFTIKIVKRLAFSSELIITSRMLYYSLVKSHIYILWFSNQTTVSGRYSEGF